MIECPQCLHDPHLRKFCVWPKTGGNGKKQSGTGSAVLPGSPPGAGAPPAGEGQALYGSVVPQNMAKTHKKNGHSRFPGHKLRRCNFVARVKRFT